MGCPDGKLGCMMTTVNTEIMDFCISSARGRLAEGAALCVKASWALVWCVQLAHRGGTWCEGANIPLSSVVLGVTQFLQTPEAFLKVPYRTRTYMGYALDLFTFYFLQYIITGLFDFLSSAFEAVFCGINILWIPVNIFFHSIDTCN